MAAPGPEFLVAIDYDRDTREYRAAVINRRYAVRLAAPSVARVKYRMLRLLRVYLNIAEAEVVFLMPGRKAERDRQAA